MYIVYKYTNKINGKIYIGQTSFTLEQRAGKDGSNYHGSTYFYSAIQKYGWNNFESTILKDGLIKEEADYWEMYFIKQFDAQDSKIGYNIAAGGSSGPVAESTRKKISEKAKERYQDPTKNPMYQHFWTEEQRRTMSNSRKGKGIGCHRTEEQKQHLRELFKDTNKTMRKTPITDEERQKMSEHFREIAKRWRKKVFCIEDNLFFDSITEAAHYYHVDTSTLWGQLNGKQHTCANRHYIYA